MTFSRLLVPMAMVTILVIVTVSSISDSWGGDLVSGLESDDRQKRDLHNMENEPEDADHMVWGSHSSSSSTADNMDDDEQDDPDDESETPLRRHKGKGGKKNKRKKRCHRGGKKNQCGQGSTCVHKCKSKCVKNQMRDDAANCAALGAKCEAADPKSCCSKDITANDSTLQGICQPYPIKCIKCIMKDNTCDDERRGTPCCTKFSYLYTGNNKDLGGCGAENKCSETCLKESRPCDPSKTDGTDYCSDGTGTIGACHPTRNKTYVCVASSSKCMPRTSCCVKVSDKGALLGGCMGGTCAQNCIAKDQACDSSSTPNSDTSSPSDANPPCCGDDKGTKGVIGACKEVSIDTKKMDSCTLCLAKDEDCSAKAKASNDCCPKEGDKTMGGCQKGKCTDTCIREGQTCDPEDANNVCCDGERSDSAKSGFCHPTTKKCILCITKGTECGRGPCCPNPKDGEKGGCLNGTCVDSCITVGNKCEADSKDCCGGYESSRYLPNGVCTFDAKCTACVPVGETCAGGSKCCRTANMKDPNYGGCKKEKCVEDCISYGKPCNPDTDDDKCCDENTDGNDPLAKGLRGFCKPKTNDPKSGSCNLCFGGDTCKIYSKSCCGTNNDQFNVTLMTKCANPSADNAKLGKCPS